MSWYCGIDQSYTGFAVVHYNPETGEHRDSVKAFKAKGVHRLEDISGHLHGVVDRNVCHIAMEGYANGMKFGRELAGELGAIVKMTLYEAFPTDDRGYPTIIPPTSVKKYATGKGTAKKQEMLLAVYKKWDVEYHNDNLADAYVLARMAAAIAHENHPDLLAYEKEVLAKLTPFTEKP